MCEVGDLLGILVPSPNVQVPQWSASRHKAKALVCFRDSLTVTFPAPKVLFRAMRSTPDGLPVCGQKATNLGVRERDLPPDKDGMVSPNKGGMSATPDDPRLLPEEFRPESLGGFGRLPVFSVDVAKLGRELQARRDPNKPNKHVFVEPAARMLFAEYERLVCATAQDWKKENL
jgi:hypothetical protein